MLGGFERWQSLFAGDLRVLRSAAMAERFDEFGFRDAPYWRKPRRLLVVAVVLVVASTAGSIAFVRFGNSDPKGQTTPATTSGPAAVGGGAVSPNGSTLTTPLGVRVDIPAGAISADGVIDVSRSPLPADTGSALTSIGPLVDVRLSGATILSPIHVTLPITDASTFEPVTAFDGSPLDAAPVVVVAHWTGQAWKALETSVDRASSTATGTASSLSPFGVFRVGWNFISGVAQSTVEQLTGGLATFVPHPACSGTDDAAPWSAAPADNPVSWCAAVRPDGTTVLQLANRRRYAVSVAAPGGRVSGNSTDLSAQLSQLTSGAGTVVLAPGEVADILFPSGASSQRVTVNYDGGAQVMTTMLVAADLVGQIAKRMPFPNPTTSAQFLETLDKEGCVAKLGIDPTASASYPAATITKLLLGCFRSVGDVLGKLVSDLATSALGSIAYFVSSGQSLFDLITGGANGTLSRSAPASAGTVETTVTTVPTTPLTTTPSTTSQSQPGSSLSADLWSIVGQTVVSPVEADGSFTLQAGPSIYWSGLRAQVSTCDYRFSGEGRSIGGHGYGLVARTTFDANGSPTNGHGIQYDPESGGFRDTEYPDVESAPQAPNNDDDQWHTVAIEVRGNEYRSFVDGVLIFHGTTDATCGYVFVRVWRGSAAFRNLRIEPLTAATETSQASVPTAAVGPCTTWSPAQDFQTSPHQANPSPDRCGTANVWTYYFGPGDDPSTFQILKVFQSPARGLRGLQRWFDGSAPFGGVYFNATAQDIGSGQPSGYLQVHPADHLSIVVGWRSPIAQTVAISGAIIDRDPTCGDGVSWTIMLNSTKGSSGHIPNGGQQQLAGFATGEDLSAISVGAGQSIYFAISSTGSCDTTGLDVFITKI